VPSRLDDPTQSKIGFMMFLHIVPMSCESKGSGKAYGGRPPQIQFLRASSRTRLAVLDGVQSLQSLERARNLATNI
jgi:hypothetical protein